MVADDQWALLKLHDGDTLDLRTGPSEVLAVRAVACQHCGYLRLYDARYI
jgi:hypothetical protein